MVASRNRNRKRLWPQGATDSLCNHRRSELAPTVSSPATHIDMTLEKKKRFGIATMRGTARWHGSVTLTAQFSPAPPQHPSRLPNVVAYTHEPATRSALMERQRFFLQLARPNRRATPKGCENKTANNLRVSCAENDSDIVLTERYVVSRPTVHAGLETRSAHQLFNNSR